VLHQTPVPAQLNRFQAAILSRIKVMANLDIAEKRLPMDGRIGLRVQGRDIDIRVSTMPTVYGESISLRLLQGRGQFITMPELGMSQRDTHIMQKVINRPNGIVLVTGPTGPANPRRCTPICTRSTRSISAFLRRRSRLSMKCPASTRCWCGRTSA